MRPNRPQIDRKVARLERGVRDVAYVADPAFEPRNFAVDTGGRLAASRLPDPRIKARMLASIRGHLLAAGCESRSAK